MEDKLSSLGLSIDRVVIQLIIPGLVASFPFIIIFMNNFPFEKNLLLTNVSLLIPFVTVIALISGIILENAGSIIEVHCYDRRNEKKFKDYHETWNKFLILDYKGKEPSGHRYLRNILLRMKFELSFAFAMFPMATGLIILDSQHILIGSCILKIILFILLPIGIAFYLLLKEAYDSSKVLAKTRQLLVNKYGGS